MTDLRVSTPRVAEDRFAPVGQARRRGEEHVGSGTTGDDVREAAPAKEAGGGLVADAPVGERLAAPLDRDGTSVAGRRDRLARSRPRPRSMRRGIFEIPVARLAQEERAKVGLDPDELSPADDDGVEPLRPGGRVVGGNPADLDVEAALDGPRVPPHVAPQLRREEHVLGTRSTRAAAPGARRIRVADRRRCQSSRRRAGRCAS